MLRGSILILIAASLHSVAHAQLIFNFDEVNGDVVMTASGSFDTSLLINQGPTAASWSETAFEVNTFSTPNLHIIGSNGVPYNNLDTHFGFSDGTDFSAWLGASGPFAGSFSDFDTVSGTTDFSTHTRPTLRSIAPGLLVSSLDLVNGIWTPDNVWTEFGSTFTDLGLTPGTYTVTDVITGASISYVIGPLGPSLEELLLSSSAIPMNLAIGQLGSQLHHQATSGINSRIYRVRGRTTSGGNGTAQTTGDTLETGGRELPASRTYRSGGELRMETSINLDGTPRGTANSTKEDKFETATLHDDAPFLSEERPAGVSLDPGVLASGDNWMIYSSANFGNVGLDNLGANPGFQSYTYSSTLGFEYQVSDELAFGLGWSHIWNDNTMNGGLGTADLEGDAAIAYATYFKSNFWADLLYSYGSYEADIRRISGGGTSVASPDLEAHLLSLNLGYNIEGDFTGTRLAKLTEGENRIVHGPTLGVDYSTGMLDGYTETGNPGFDAVFLDQDYNSLVTTIGWQATLTQVKNWGQLRPQVRLGYGREHLNQNTSVTGSLATNPLITATGTAISPGDNWMEVGAGVAFQFNNSNLVVYLDYTGQYFREDAEVHHATLGAEVTF